MTEPQNILDALVDATISRKELKRILLPKAEKIREEALRRRFSKKEAENLVRNGLIDWLETKSYPSSGRKKLIDKAVGKMMRGYDSLLRQRLSDDAISAERWAKLATNELTRILEKRRARDIRARLSTGKGRS